MSPATKRTGAAGVQRPRCAERRRSASWSMSSRSTSGRRRSAAAIASTPEPVPMSSTVGPATSRAPSARRHSRVVGVMAGAEAHRRLDDDQAPVGGHRRRRTSQGGATTKGPAVTAVSACWLRAAQSSSGRSTGLERRARDPSAAMADAARGRGRRRQRSTRASAAASAAARAAAGRRVPQATRRQGQRREIFDRQRRDNRRGPA